MIIRQTLNTTRSVVMVRDSGITQYSVLWSGEDILDLLPSSLSVIIHTNLIHTVSFIHLCRDKAAHREQLGCNEIKRCKMKDVSSLLKSVQMHRMLRVIKWILIAWLCPEQHKRTHYADRRSPSPSLQRRKEKNPISYSLRMISANLRCCPVSWAW